LADKLYDLNIKMFLRDNFVHGDLHAGNLLYDESTNVLTLLDAGLVTQLGQDAEDSFGDFLRAMCAQDFDQIADCLIGFHDPGAGNCIDARGDERDTFASEIASVYTGYYDSVTPGSDPVYMGQIM
jgi:predicted unusual protein kinase regulating ubiquinone biosynthesis (AarF/ABC1/UbiB family)